MKKFITSLIVLVSVAVQMEASDMNIYFRTDLVDGGWGGRNSNLKFVYKGANPSNADEDVYTFSINSENIVSRDIYFRLWVDGWNYEFAPDCNTHNYSYEFPFTNGQYDTYDVKVHWDNYKNQGQPSGWSEKSSDRAFKIPQSSINASEYLITLYCKNTYTTGDNIHIKVDIVSMPVTIGSTGKATFSCDRALDFTGTGISANMITGVSGVALTTTPVTKVPANTGLYLEGSEGTVNVPVVSTSAASDVDTSDNLLVKGGESTVVDGEEGDPVTHYNYILTNRTVNGDAPIKFYKANHNSVAVGKAYLHIPTSMVAARDYLWFDDEVTGIEAVKATQKMNGEFFNLAGQRVAQPAKGLYIVNGKKVIIK